MIVYDLDYAWYIHTEFIDDEGEPTGVNGRPFIVHGPRDAPEELLEALHRGFGDPFKMYDDDGNLCLGGHILALSGEHAWNEDEHIAFGPLNDYGMGGYGCTEIWYPSGPNGKWEQL